VARTGTLIENIDKLMEKIRKTVSNNAGLDKTLGLLESLRGTSAICGGGRRSSTGSSHAAGGGTAAARDAIEAEMNRLGPKTQEFDISAQGGGEGVLTRTRKRKRGSTRRAGEQGAALEKIENHTVTLNRNAKASEPE